MTKLETSLITPETAAELNQRQVRIQLFEAIRDIPYFLSDNTTDTSCKSKAKILGEIFSRLGFDCRLGKCKFNWGQLNLPPWLLEIAAPEFPSLESGHTFLEVKLQPHNPWIQLDPTWDKALNPPLPLVTWDGLTSTPLAVTALPGSISLITNANSQPVLPLDLPFPSRDTSSQFLNQFNQWLQDTRKLNQAKSFKK